MKSIAVLGGNGFLGSKICELGVRHGWAVTSLSRSGLRPRPIKGHDTAWMDQVRWQKGDLFDPSSYKEHLIGKNAVVHSVGILLEDTRYKKTLKDDFSVLAGILTLVNAIKGPNPMERTSKNTYAAIQRDSALLLAKTYLEAAKDVENPTFAYISADEKPPVIVPQAYLTTKREAEYGLSREKDLRSIFMRPGFMYDPEDGLNARTVMGETLNKQYEIAKKLGIVNAVKTFPMIDKVYRPPVTTEQVAEKLFQKLEQETFAGVVRLEEIREE